MNHIYIYIHAHTNTYSSTSDVCSEHPDSIKNLKNRKKYLLCHKSHVDMVARNDNVPPHSRA